MSPVQNQNEPFRGRDKGMVQRMRSFPVDAGEMAVEPN